MSRIVHRDEALDAAKQIGKELLGRTGVDCVAIVDDVFARFHLLVWLVSADAVEAFEREWQDVEQRLTNECGPFWSRDRMVSIQGAPSPDREVFERAREIGIPIGESPQRDRLLLVDRHRSRTSWFAKIAVPSEGSEHRAPVVAFYSYKGGMGRTTAAAAYAIHRARNGARVIVVDLDLDAPGIGRLLANDEDGQTAPWGALDFLLEHHAGYPLEEYRHVCARPEVTGEAFLEVFPAAAANDQYLSKLSKVDFDLRETDDPSRHPVAKLLGRIQSELHPDVVVVDCRAGLAPVAGLMLTGLADVHVLFSTASSQAIDGLARVVNRLGAERVRHDLPQAECVLVHAMVPENVDARERAASYFEAKAENIFDDHYYIAKADEEETLWSLEDKSSRFAPHRAVMLPYAASLADFRDIKDVVPTLLGPAYQELVARIAERLGVASHLPSDADEGSA